MKRNRNIGSLLLIAAGLLLIAAAGKGNFLRSKKTKTVNDQSHGNLKQDDHCRGIAYSGFSHCCNHTKYDHRRKNTS